MSSQPTKAQEDACETDLYQRALYALDKAGKVSDMHKVAETTRERDFMHKNNTLMSRSSNTIPYQPGQYEKIFGGTPE